ncbi:hypothetical protein BCR34DRAFT_494517 [Clohesyomyces aquaticus]|uniref:Transcriptional regulator n=1 Tax=Clohesyomyces aquaticus TaxID=1231657 RepID=A0A1Y1YRF7_9PLEO|nr:hypothetical protein BCR34DRAFT_494517 [Clohesyomyces aquaticus]
MSGSEAADIPGEATISRALEDAVVAIYKTGNHDDLTVKRVRIKAEQQLGLPAGFFKGNAEWKQKSQTVIVKADQHGSNDAASPFPEVKKKAAKPKAAPKKKEKPAPKKKEPPVSRGAKRKSPTTPKKPQKRRKTVVSSDEESDAVESDPAPGAEHLSDAESEPPKKAVRRGKKKTVAPESDEEMEDAPDGGVEESKDMEVDEPSETTTPAKKASVAPAADTKADVSESELSSLIDESPAKKKRQKKTPAEKPAKASKAKAPAKPRAPASKSKDDDPDQAEVKRLQSWLVKCGIRKIWGKELAGCDTAKDKIRHLKDMLKDAGMEGKFSIEKATAIKEQREFAADLAAIQEQNKHWGGQAEQTNTGRPKRRAAAQNFTISKPTLDSDVEDGAEKEDSGDQDDDDDDDDDVESAKSGSDDGDDDGDGASDISD